MSQNKKRRRIQVSKQSLRRSFPPNMEGNRAECLFPRVLKQRDLPIMGPAPMSRYLRLRVT